MKADILFLKKKKQKEKKEPTNNLSKLRRIFSKEDCEGGEGHAIFSYQKHRTENTINYNYGVLHSKFYT